MTGTLLNVIGILAGGAVGLSSQARLAANQESFVRISLAVFAVYYGLRMSCVSLAGSAGHVLKSLLITVLALMIGKILGRVLRLQTFSNYLGKRACDQLPTKAGGPLPPPGDAFKATTILFCAAPLGILGAMQDAITPGGYPFPLAVKALMDGLATMAFIRTLGPGVLLSGISVLAWQGTIFVACSQFLAPFLTAHQLVDSVNAVAGLLVFCVALVILELKKIPLAEYLPSLAVAPVAAWLAR